MQTIEQLIQIGKERDEAHQQISALYKRDKQLEGELAANVGTYIHEQQLLSQMSWTLTAKLQFLISNNVPPNLKKIAPYIIYTNIPLYQDVSIRFLPDNKACEIGFYIPYHDKLAKILQFIQEHKLKLLNPEILKQVTKPQLQDLIKEILNATNAKQS